MSSPVKHHYVPKTYLKQFAYDKKNIFQSDKTYKKISIKNISQICYQHNYYKIAKTETKLFNKISDEYYIEKKRFEKQENSYESLLNKIIVPHRISFEISVEDITLFMQTIVSIKVRNPTYKQSILDTWKSHFTSDKFKKEFSPYLEIAKKIQPEVDAHLYFTKYIENIQTDEEKQSDLYLSRFLPEKDVNVANVANTLLWHIIYIYHAPVGSEFITSDNPGFTFVSSGPINFGGLGGDFIFIFPLTPQQCLLIDSKKKDNMSFTKKKIIPEFVSLDFVDAINRYTLKIAKNKVFGSNSKVLKQCFNLPQE